MLLTQEETGWDLCGLTRINHFPYSSGGFLFV
jgi:hypothetical protein